jgi:nitrogen regulatory protein PII
MWEAEAVRRHRILSKMKRVEIMVESKELDALVRLVMTHATGYTLIRGATGYGEHGLIEAELVLLVTVVTPEHLDAIVDAILPTLSQHANIVLITDVTVLRAEHFIPEVRAAAKRSTV